MGRQNLATITAAAHNGAWAANRAASPMVTGHALPKSDFVKINSESAMPRRRNGLEFRIEVFYCVARSAQSGLFPRKFRVLFA
jgi:hypothetical protein